MSKKIKAILLKQITDKKILSETLEQLNIKYTQKGNEIQLNQSCKLVEKNGFYTAEILEDYYSTESMELAIESNKMIQSIMKTYQSILNEKLDSLRRQNIENEILGAIRDETKNELLRRQKKELLRLENIQRLEKQALEQQIENAVTSIIESSKKHGYAVDERRHENERVLVLVRR